MTDITELTPEVARESGSILIIVAARMARREFFTPLHALCEAGKRVVSTRALRDAVERAEERMVSQVPKIVDGHDRLTKKLKEADSRNAELVEALEKAQNCGKIYQQSFFRQSLMYDVVAEAYEEAKERIAEDVEIKARLCRESNSLFDRLRAAEKRIAELESRTVTAAAADVLAERQRQVTAEGWTAEGDDSYQNSELADAAACYAIHAHNQGFSTPAHWPWSTTWWKQTNPRRDLVKAGALILAEIERIDRAAGIKVEAE
ncbi:hypothetical protein AAHU38_08490 [Klebsiella pneumoniae]